MLMPENVAWRPVAAAMHGHKIPFDDRAEHLNAHVRKRGDEPAVEGLERVTSMQWGAEFSWKIVNQ